ncbi:MAG: HNH endonuclease [Nitrososphaera sp.]|nr:HNH endonuclease [Nitrososphaera sp.]
MRGRWARPSLADRLWSKIDKTETCWLWTGKKKCSGYGLIPKGGPGKNSPALRVHRVMWELTFGPIPEGQKILHKCDVRHCVNPEHLFLGTQADNLADCKDKGRAWYQQPNASDCVRRAWVTRKENVRI